MSTYNSKFTGAQIDAMFDELIEARNGRSALDLRIDTISNFASPNAGGYVAGRFYDQSFHAGTASTIAAATNRLDLSPFYTSQQFSFDQIGLSVSTAVAGALGRIVIYSSTPEGWPDQRLFQSAELDLSTIGFKAASEGFTFDAGRQYWLGYLASAASVVHAVPTASLANLGLTTSTGAAATAYATVCRRIVPYADGAPLAWAFAASHLTASIAASIRMRAAAA